MTQATALAATDWHKSSYSATQNECVESRVDGRAVLVRDTKAKGAGPELGFAPDEWAAFIADLKEGGPLAGGLL
ncbi:DUF397 domain-containing protein [Streptomyces sp. NPDC008079]|uniref:DUF397 domain-containing protein n=1 Tax=Streptomyces sp. NPDC008079 TaxID=3364806 RepID=UPI0036E97AEB